ncbi:MAG: glycoside hydrolase family 97 protein [Acidobacteriota bacterium]
MGKMKILMVVILLPFLIPAEIKGEEYEVTSPDKRIKFVLSVNEKAMISAFYKGDAIIEPSEISMNLKRGTFGTGGHVISVNRNSISEVLKPVVKIKESEIKNHCNEMVVNFREKFYLVLRAYDNGIAYRFGMKIKGEIVVVSETGKYKFPENHMVWWGVEKKFQSHNQVYFDYRQLGKTNSGDLTSLPLIINPEKGPKIVITETDLIDYPGMWLRGTGSNELFRVSAEYPKTLVQRSDRKLPVIEREKYIAKTSGSRVFPWRIFAIAENDAGLIKNQLTYILASPNKIKDTSWIRPGKAAWDWWNANNIYGVDFKAGINTETYKYYIDFAAAYGIENIVLDEGWYELGDLSSVSPEIDLKEILSYAEGKNVGVILWCVWKTLEDQLESSLEWFGKLGVRGIKVDFMNRDDQEMVNFYHKIAKKAARYHLVVDFHGSYKPAGLRRMYPNVLTREGVNGGEQFKWSVRQTPEHDLIIPFGRMLAGPMDYTPGAMHNARNKDFKPIFDTPMSMGTRCHQLAMFVCYESPLQMLCDSPSNYYKEPECMEFLSAVPTVWDETVVIKARVSDYLFIARRHGRDWYVGGMTDWTSRDLDLDLSFLPEGEKFKMTLYQDGINADRIAIDFKQIKIVVDNTYNRKVRLAKGGGLAIMLKPVK